MCRNGVQPSPTQQSRLACRQAGTNSASTRSVSPCAHTLPHLLHGIRREAAAGLVKHACQACQHLGMPAAKAVGHIHLHARNLHRPTPKGCIAREGLVAKVAAGVPSPEGSCCMHAPCGVAAAPRPSAAWLAAPPWQCPCAGRLSCHPGSCDAKTENV